MKYGYFEWNEFKNILNKHKHGISFYTAQEAFNDPCRVITEDLEHSQSEQRYYCLGKVGTNIMTVRFTYRNHIIRIIGAGYWRKGKKIYEQTQR